MIARFAIVAFAFALALPARAGVVLQYDNDAGKKTTLELQGKSFRSDGGRGEGGSAIFDGEKHVFYTLDDAGKTYRKIDEASGAAMANNVNDALEQAKARMTPEQRAKLEAMLAKQHGAAEKPTAEHSWKFERTAGTQQVAGLTCDNYRVFRDGELQSEGCFVPWGSGSVRKDDFQAFHEMGLFFDKTFASMGQGRGQRARRGPGGDWVTHFVDSAPGFPGVVDRVDKDGKRTRQMRLLKVERASIASSRFAPPADYREKPLGMANGRE